MALTKVQRAAVAERRAMALRLKASGASLDRIASELGYSNGHVASADISRAIKARLDDVGAAVDELRVVEDVHLDELRRRMMAVLTSGDPDTQMKATDRLVKVAERKAKLNGFDASDERDERLVRVAEAQALMLASAFRDFARRLGHDTSAPEVREAFRASLQLVQPAD